jgi:methylmalonyl-CoA mutase, N-terminal domain
VVIGVNRFTSAGDEPGEPYQPLRVDPSIEQDQAERLARLRRTRNAGQWQRRITDLKKAAAGSQNVLVPLREALRAEATVGEACDALREVWGVYRPAEIT